MTEAPARPIPEGYTRLAEGLGFTDGLQPCYRRIEGESVSFGLWVDQQHGNSMGICHGGVLMTLADITAAAGVNVALGSQGGLPTINLALDFIAAARIGQWIQADVQLVSLKRRVGFCSGVIVHDAGTVARFNGTFYLPESAR